MKVSEMIKQLIEKQTKYGDCETIIFIDGQEINIESIVMRGCNEESKIKYQILLMNE